MKGYICTYCVMRMHIVYVCMSSCHPCLPRTDLFCQRGALAVTRWLTLLDMMTDERGAGLLEADNGRGNWELLLSAVLEWLVRQSATMVVCLQMYTTRREWLECYLRHGSWFDVADQLFERVGWVNSSWCCEVGVGGWPYWRVH